MKLKKLIKIAMVKIRNQAKNKSLDIRFALQKHDELIYQVREDQVELSSTLVREIVGSVLQDSDLTLTVNVKIGKELSFGASKVAMQRSAESRLTI